MKDVESLDPKAVPEYAETESVIVSNDLFEKYKMSKLGTAILE